MHPQVYLRTFWKQELKPQIFVAMSFAPEAKERFDQVIAPAIQAIAIDGQELTAHRVDLSKSGDAILTEIMDGIAHSRMVLADVSTIGKDSKHGRAYRNANVMYEVGLALACRHPSEVLLVRDDYDPFLFDVSTVPHKNIDFTDIPKAKAELAEELASRLREANQLEQVRAELAYSSLTYDEVAAMLSHRKYMPPLAFGMRQPMASNMGWRSASLRLLDKHLIRCVGLADDATPIYQFTFLGLQVLNRLENDPRYQPVSGVQIPDDQPPPPSDSAQ